MAITDLTGTKWQFSDTITQVSQAAKSFIVYFTVYNNEYPKGISGNSIYLYGSSDHNRVDMYYEYPEGQDPPEFFRRCATYIERTSGASGWIDEKLVGNVSAPLVEVTGGADADDPDIIAFFEANATQIVDPPQDWLYKFLSDSGLTRVFQKLKTVLDKKAALDVSTISTAGGGTEVHATMSQGEDEVSVNYYKQGTELPDYVNLTVNGDWFSFPTRNSVDNKVPFVATYEQATYADVTAAIDADRSIVVNFPANRNLICVTYSTYVPSQNVLMYGIFKTQNWVSLATITLTPANEWRVTHTKLQELLESGINIKTVNNQSLLGSGNIDVGGGGSVFVALKDETTYAEIVAAKNEDKIIIAKFIDEIYQQHISLVISDINVQSDRVIMRGDGANRQYEIDVRSSGEWSVATYGRLWPELHETTSSYDIRLLFERPYDGRLGFGLNKSGEGFDTSKVRLNLDASPLDHQLLLPTTEYTGDLAALTTDDKTNLVSAINEVYEKSGEPFRVKNWANSSLNVSIPYCTEEIANTSIAKMTYSIDAEEGASYQIVGMIAYEVFDSSNQRINCWPVCQFTGNGQKELSVRWACMGSSRKTATKINAWVLLKHR